MTSKWLPLLLATVCFLTLTFGRSNPLHGDDSDEFRELLELAGAGPDQLSALGSGPKFSEADLKLIAEVFNRLRQFPDFRSSQAAMSVYPEIWSDEGENFLGKIFEVRGQIISAEKVSWPDEWKKLQDYDELFRCTFKFADSDDEASATAVVLTPQVPKLWQSKQLANEPVQLRCVLAQLEQTEGATRPLLITDHIGWYPTDGAPTGQLLLARHGMDVALLDEVKHRQPFVKPQTSREGEAFYSGLTALREANQLEIVSLAKANIAPVAKKWKQRQPDFETELRRLAAELAKATDDDARLRLTSEVRRAKTRYGLATTVTRQAENGQSSVATMFLRPEQEVGELFYFEGTARRAIWIAVEGQASLPGYYELEVFPSEARLLENRPVVCCLTTLPAAFPTGDEIREPVQIAGVFFKSWKYRSRTLQSAAGETDRQRQLYTPVLLGKMPTWLNKSVARESGWAIGGGIAFLAALLLMWLTMAWLSKRDDRARKTLRPTETIDL